ncbi:hypothetical protein TRICI_005622 [Trichomonascus ciferrii]|uniref:GATA-type domain-containing protein n=1 Tax=Trichomonascus ciferrii TaxID=44093 RepID=A0A642UY16_9ASCO|nr:hypothetical protein TRICI_005622 [Trichomonascus ciferrii]
MEVAKTSATPTTPVPAPASSGGGEDSKSSSTSSTTTICQNCQTSTTPLWRRDESGQVLCNACGLFLKLHGRRRPISLKTDVIKSRNRSRSTHATQLKGGAAAKRAAMAHHHPHPHPHVHHHPHAQHHAQPPPPPPPNALPPLQMVPSTPSTVFSYPNSPTLAPFSRTGSPRPNGYLPPPRSVTSSPNGGSQQHQTTTAPPPPPQPHSAPPQQAPPPPPQQQQQTSPRLPSLSSLNSPKHKAANILTPQSRPHSPDEKNKGSDSRVTELELVNDLLRSRITQLEASESAARQAEAALRAQLKKVSEENEQLSKRLADTPSPTTSNATTNDDRQSKRIKISDML